jgi:hypothetical protein
MGYLETLVYEKMDLNKNIIIIEVLVLVEKISSFNIDLLSLY